MAPSDSRGDPPPPMPGEAAGQPHPSQSRPNPPPPGRRGAVARTLLRLVLLLIVLGALAVFFRLDILNRAGPWLLGRELGVPVDLAVTQLDWRTSRIERVMLGSQRDLVVEDIELAYDPLDGRLESIAIGRVALRARFDLSRDAGVSLGELDPLIDRLQALAGAPGEPAATAPLPEITVKSIEIGLVSPAGFITGTGQAHLNDQAVIAQLTLREQQDFGQLDVSLAAPLVKNGKPPIGDLHLALDARSALWPLFGLAQPDAGSIRIDAHLRVPETSAAPQAPLALADWSVEAVDFAYPGLAVPLTGTLSGAASYGADWLRFDGIKGDVKGGASLAFAAKLGGAIGVSLLSDGQKIVGEIDLDLDGGDLDLPEIKANRVKLALPLSLAVTRQAGANVIDVTLRGPGSISTERLALADGAVVLAKPTTFPLKAKDAGKVHVTMDPAAGIAADFELGLAKTALNVELKTIAERLLIAMPEARISGRYTTDHPLAYAFDVKGAQVAAPLRGLTVGQVALALSGGEKGISAKLTTGALAGLGAFTPVRASADATLQAGRAAFKAHFRGAEQPLDLALIGRVDLARKSGTIDLKLSPLDFAPGTLQPYNLFPPLRDYFDDVSGRVELAGPVHFAGGMLTSDLKLGLKGFSGKVGPVLLTNVNTVLEIDRPWPLSTKPDQVVAVELADVGLPLTNALFRFKVSDGKVLDLKESRLDMAGGKVTLDPAILTFDAPAQNLLLKADGISVTRLFDTLGIAGLSGEGSISGAVPVTIFPGGIAIPGAELGADAPGVLRYDRAQAPLALQSAGESVAMALEALADFHYEKLILNLTRSLTGDVNLGLHIAGRNPSFYDGYPVEFNLSIEGRLDQALKEGLAGYQVPDMIRQQLEKLSP